MAKKAKRNDIKQALASAANAIALLAASMKSYAKVPERAAESPPAGEEDLLLLFKSHRVMKATAELLGAVEGCDEDAQDEINREFGIVRKVLEDNSFLDGPRGDDY